MTGRACGIWLFMVLSALQTEHETHSLLLLRAGTPVCADGRIQCLLLKIASHSSYQLGGPLLD